MENLCRMKALFGVSAEAFALRLEELGLVAPALRVELREALRTCYKAHPDAMEPPPNLPELNIGGRLRALLQEPPGRGLQMEQFAHSRQDLPIDQWQTLQDHCNGVASLCSGFAGAFGSDTHGKLLGEVHDIGKSRPSFQSYLRRCNGMEDGEADYGDRSHSGAGAVWLAGNFNGIGKALAYCVAGHHAGLPDWSGGRTPDGALV